MPSPSPLKSHAQVLLVVCASSIAVLYLWAYRQRVNDDERVDGKGGGDGHGDHGGRGRQQAHATSDGPMFDYNNPILCDRVVRIARQRAERWRSYQVSGAGRMVGQVGGKSVHKRPILMCEPDLILKPLSLDHRGIREIAFYEAIQASAKRSGFETYAELFRPHVAKPRASARSAFARFIGRQSKEPGSTDTLSPYENIFIELETKILHRGELFTPEYMGIVEYTDGPPSEGATEGLHGLNSNWYIALRNLTTHFSQPCVLDFKMGTETYEPDAPEDKKLRERIKYPLQEEFGFRIVAMRMYIPADVEADDDGYVYFPKSFGRSLGSRDQVKHAIRTFFGGIHLSKPVRANRSTAIKRILTKLKLIKGWFRENTVFSFYASSLLMIYEGTTESNEIGGVDLGMKRSCMLWLFICVFHFGQLLTQNESTIHCFLFSSFGECFYD